MENNLKYALEKIIEAYAEMTQDAKEMPGDEAAIAAVVGLNALMSRLQGVIDMMEGDEEISGDRCEHDWVSAVNSAIKSGYYCPKCSAVKT